MGELQWCNFCFMPDKKKFHVHSLTTGRGFILFIYIVDAPQAITGDRVNRECYMQVRGRVHNSHLGACFCVARL